MTAIVALFNFYVSVSEPSGVTIRVRASGMAGVTRDFRLIGDVVFYRRVQREGDYGAGEHGYRTGRC